MKNKHHKMVFRKRINPAKKQKHINEEELNRKYSKYVLNQKRSPLDPRDLHVDTHLMTAGPIVLPDVFDPRKNLFPIRNQGQRGTCAAFSAAELKESQEIIDSKITEYLSPEFVYDQRENRNDPEGENEGMNNLDVMKILKNKGICYEKTYPYNPIEDTNAITKNAYDEAKEFVIEKYGRVNSIDACKYAIYKNGSVIVANPVYNFTWRFWKKRPGDEFHGGHDTTFCGWTKDGFIMRNHWGTDWADNGYTLFPYEDWGLQYEVYSAIDKTFGQTQPIREKTTNWLKNKLIYILGGLVGLGILYYIAHTLNFL